MLKVTNVSKRNVNLGEVILSSFQSYVFKNGVSDEIKVKINSLVNIGILKVYNITDIEEEKSSKKSNKRK